MPARAPSRCRVEVGDVRAVMLVVVDLHRLRVDVGLERVEGVRQGRQGESHGVQISRITTWTQPVRCVRATSR